MINSERIAVILSTRKNNGVVEVEASNSDDVIHKHKEKLKRKRVFKVFMKEIKNENDNISFIDKKIKKTSSINKEMMFTKKLKMRLHL